MLSKTNGLGYAPVLPDPPVWRRIRWHRLQHETPLPHAPGVRMTVVTQTPSNKGVLDRPWTKWMVLRAISSTLKFQFTENHENRLARRLVRPDPAKVREKSFVCSVRSSRTPLDLPNFNLNYSFPLDFSSFTNKCLDDMNAQ